MGDVIDFDAARERVNSPKSNYSNPILRALDVLGLALVEHEHQWTDEERNLYETAVEYLK